MSLEDMKAGEVIRREVMGSTHVDASLGNATELDMPLQEAAMEHVWGGVWTRDGLDRRTRSIVTVSMLIALQAHGELKGHVRGALNNGVTPEEVREIIMHAAAYCGYPQALSAMRVAREVIDQYEG
ncbi:4-carboxymuconolactone decarboxylase [Halioglobus japonicus]|uniref:4-carboxymuconolactone decarboxylase n=1 Tax=Halioglobus japonicus TaxID=930805 RepID=A0AAP8SNT7_9GAMM|nr:carboxymuconolactone decarboxylase family protein [Halioglobus japonicus]AQA18803.1 4-carboxymuconolactone decarboxylase [Halioglobus japonicus]PLW86834.1 4-carboxymuconolactone decarboxylase [Halioglobus japonicus]GHD23807.1 4-carboxymuconolactone decarboxylase [Halioglobus japonicus]